MIREFIIIGIVYISLIQSIVAVPLQNQATQNSDNSYSGSEQFNQASKEGNNVSKTLVIKNAWARQSISSNNNSAVYMSVENPTENQLTIVGASAMLIANHVELNKSFIDENGVSRMVSIDKLVVPAESKIDLAPGGTHIMLFDLKRRLNLGDKFDLKLAIDNQSPVVVNVEVK